jgi:hypothetical protein
MQVFNKGVLASANIRCQVSESPQACQQIAGRYAIREVSDLGNAMKMLLYVFLRRKMPNAMLCYANAIILGPGNLTPLKIHLLYVNSLLCSCP